MINARPRNKIVNINIILTGTISSVGIFNVLFLLNYLASKITIL
jgi:hypothetical protein